MHSNSNQSETKKLLTCKWQESWEISWIREFRRIDDSIFVPKLWMDWRKKWLGWKTKRKRRRRKQLFDIGEESSYAEEENNLEFFFEN